MAPSSRALRARLPARHSSASEGAGVSDCRLIDEEVPSTIEHVAFRMSHLKRLGNQISVPIKTDEEGYLGRECPEAACEGYFKVKSGTGLTGADIPCHCPYCGHAGPPTEFWTKEQLEYAKSIALRQITDAFRADLKSLEFEHEPKGPFGIGISMKLQPGPPIPIRHYRERTLETKVTCSSCTLEYAVYGVFGFCPDCGIHNSLQILQRNLELVRKQLDLANAQSDPELTRHLLDDALENCVSVFDGFGRELCRLHAGKSSAPNAAGDVSFQNLSRAANRVNQLFGIDLTLALPSNEWQGTTIAFLRRHLLAHKAGVIDAKYLQESGEPSALLGRRIVVSASDISTVAANIEHLAVYLFTALIALP